MFAGRTLGLLLESLGGGVATIICPAAEPIAKMVVKIDFIIIIIN
jgi:hypothetical protein